MDSQSQLAMERLLADAAQNLLTAGDELPDTIVLYLGRFARLLGASRCQWLRLAHDQGAATSEHEWCAKTLTSFVGVSFSRNDFPSSWEAVMRGEDLIASCMHTGQAANKELEALVRQEGISGCVATPASEDGVAQGLLATDFVHNPPKVDADFLDAHRRFARLLLQALGRHVKSRQDARNRARMAQRQRLVREDVESQLAMERLLAEAARDLFTAQGNDLPHAVRRHLRRFGQKIGASRCLWFSVAPDLRWATSEYEWLVDGLASSVGATYTRAELPQTYEALAQCKVVVARDTDPEDAPFPDMSAILRAEGMRCVILLPAVEDDVAVGLLATDFVRDEPRLDENLFDAYRRFVDTMRLALKRRAELEQASLVEARLSQKQKLESLGLLAGGIAHDFNNALQVILVSSEMLRDQIADAGDDAGQSLELIAQAAESANDLTCRLLMFGRDEVTTGRADTSEALRRVFDMARRMIPESVETSMLVDVDLPAVPLRRGNFEQAVLNLMTNALHAMPDGGRLVVKANTYREEHQEYVNVSVTDTGKGMSPEQLAQACEPFFTTKAPGEGTGLGLATVRSMARRAGGQLLLDSAVGKGTNVRLVLPAAKPDSLVAPRSPDTSPTGSETILVVEDNVLVRRVAQSVLERAGYTVVVAQHGLEALAHVQTSGAQAVDLIVSDAIMPRMGGRALYEACQDLGLSVPFLFCTGYTGFTLDAAFIEETGCQVLPKPWKPNELLARVRQILDEAGAPRVVRSYVREISGGLVRKHGTGGRDRGH